jgi:hypothetical protein
MTIPAQSVEGLFWQLWFLNIKYKLLLVAIVFAIAILWQYGINPLIIKSGIFRDEKKMYKFKKDK